MDFEKITDMILSYIEKRNSKKNKLNRVMIQVPEGLKMNIIKIADKLQKEGIDVVISCDECFGACDLRDDEALKSGCRLLVHIGHTKFWKDFETKVDVIYIPAEIFVNVSDIDFACINEKRIAVYATAQHMCMVDDIMEKLERHGKLAVRGGQVLGCYAEETDADACLVIASGVFHAGMLSKKFKSRPVYILDTERKAVKLFDSAKEEKKRIARIFRVKGAEKFGILVSSKAGQFAMQKALKIREMLNQRNKKSYILIMDTVNDSRLYGIDVDVFINTACPRISEDVFSKPVVNADEVEEVFK